MKRKHMLTFIPELKYNIVSVKIVSQNHANH